MDERTVFFARGRIVAISLAGILVALGVLCLAVLVSAQAPPVSVDETAATDLVSTELPPVSTEEITATDLISTEMAPVSTEELKALLSTGTVVTDSAPVNVVGISLTGSKSASSGQVPKGSMVSYTVTFDNSGTATANLSAITDTLPAQFAFRQMVSGPLPKPTIQGRNLIWAGPIPIPPGGQLRFSYRVTVDGTVNQTYSNSVRAELSGGLVGPYPANVKVLQPRAYLPLIVKTSAPAIVYRLAYDSKPGDNFEVFAVNADGTDLLNVSNEAGGDADADWSPGGKIAWVHYKEGKGDIWSANADGSDKKNLTDHAKDDRAPDWSPDGTKIAFASYREGDRWEVYVMNADGTNVKKLTTQSCQSHDPVWSPDGAKIVFICGLNEWQEIYVMNADGSNQIRLTDDEVPEEALAWSPDSTKLAYVQFTSRTAKDSEIYMLDVATSTSTRLTTNSNADYSPVWSPDGTKIAFSTFIGDNYEIATMSPDGSNIVNVTKAAQGDFVPRWSADGNKISFISNRDGGKDLYVMNADGTGQFRLTTTSQDVQEHQWRP